MTNEELMKIALNTELELKVVKASELPPDKVIRFEPRKAGPEHYRMPEVINVTELL